MFLCQLPPSFFVLSLEPLELRLLLKSEANHRLSQTQQAEILNFVVCFYSGELTTGCNGLMVCCFMFLVGGYVQTGLDGMIDDIFVYSNPATAEKHANIRAKWSRFSKNAYANASIPIMYNPHQSWFHNSYQHRYLVHLRSPWHVIWSSQKYVMKMYICTLLFQVVYDMDHYGPISRC